MIFRDLPEYSLLYHSAYVKAATNAEFIDQIRRLFKDSELYKKATEMSSRWLDQFDQQRVKDDLIRLYQRLMP